MRLNKIIRSHRRAKRSESNSALNAAKAAFSALQYLEGRSCFNFPSSNKTLESEIARHRKTFACVSNVCCNFVDEVSAASDRVPPQEFDMDFDNDSFIFPSSYPSSLIDLQSRAVPMRASDVSLPTREDPSTSAVTEGHVLDMSGEHPSNEAPSPFICGPRVEYIKLLTRMVDIGMVELRHFSADIVRNGFFTVSRPDGGQRAILASVPANCCHHTPPNPRIPGPDVVAALRVPLGATLHVACLYLSKFYDVLSTVTAAELPTRLVTCFGPDSLFDDLRIFTLDSTLGNTALQCYEQAVEERKGLRCNAEKRSPSLPTNQVMGHSLRNNIYKPDPLKLTKLMEKTTSVCSHGATSGRMIQRLVGCWTWVMLLKRPFNLATATIWKSVVRELMLARALAPLFYARISPLLFKHVIATDASESGLGVCYAPSSGILPASTLDMLRHLLTYDWKVAVSYRWKRVGEHINVLEMRAVLTAVRWFFSHQSAAGSLLILYTDSQVVLGAASKGRSSSRPLLRLLRRIASCILASGSTIYLVHVPSGMNPLMPRHARGDRSFLRRARVKEETCTGKYRPALDEFWNFALHNFRVDELKDARGIDEAFSDWIHDLYISCSGRRRQTVINANCNCGLGKTAATCKKTADHVGLTCLLALVVVRSWDPLVGLGFLLAFGAYLHVGEVCALRKEDVVFPGDKRFGSTYKHVGVVLRTTKTGANRFARITNSSVITLLQVVGRSAKSLLINCSLSRFQAFLRRTKDLLGLHAVGYTPHSLRHGAGTRYLLDDAFIEDIMLRGRLASTKSARHYIQEGSALLSYVHIKPLLAGLAVLQLLT
eukprot:g19272.t1